MNCAAVGCPDLAARPYTGAQAEAMLEAAARAYVNSPRGARIRPDGVAVSKIYAWFAEDFGGSDAAVLDHLRRYAGPALARGLAERPRIVDHAYDCSLNDAR